MTGRIIYDMPRAEYDQLDADNWSTLKRIARSPAHYRHGLDEEQEDTDALRVGRAGHIAILEPESFRLKVAVWTGGRRYGTQWEQFRDNNADRDIITAAEAEMIQAMADSVSRAHHVTPFLDGRAEVSVLWDAEIVPGFLVPCKARPDMVTETHIVDLKLVRDASAEAFGRQALSLGYLSQAAFYADGYAEATGTRKPFAFVAVEKCPPYCAAVYLVTDEQLAYGRAEYQRLISILSLCRIRGEWPGYQSQPECLVLPRWAQRQAEETLTTEIGASHEQ